MPSKNPLLSLRITPAQMAVIEQYWRFQTTHRHLSDAARELFAAGAAAKGLDWPPEPAPEPPASS